MRANKLEVYGKWRRLANKLIGKLGSLDIKDIRQHRLKVIGKWRSLANKMVNGITKEDVIEMRQQKLEISAKWNVLSRKLLKEDKVSENWKKLVSAMYRNGKIEADVW